MVHNGRFQAITTKFLAPTNTQGARVKATAAADSITVPWDNAVGVYENHAAAAQALVDRMEWGGEWVGGGLPKDGYCFVRMVSAQCK